MKKLSNWSILLVVMLIAIGCNDIFEEDISGEELMTLAPLDQSVIEGNTAQFRWNYIEDVENYRIQVFEESQQRNITDSLITENSITLNLGPGDYSWKVRGENFAYQTSYSQLKFFKMISSDDLSLQKVFLDSPSENFYTNKKNVILIWQKIQSAASYSLLIDKTVQGNTITDFQIANLTENNYTLDASVLDTDAIYTWKVKALNENSETEFSERKIFLDTQNPGQPILELPINDSREVSTVDFSWSLATDSGEVQSPLYSIIEIASDSNFATIIQTTTSNTNTYQYTFSTTGEYYWRVKVFDNGSNESSWSEIRTLIVE